MEGAFVALVWVSASGRLRLLEWPPLLFLGDVSYSLYLVHQIVGFWIILHLERAGLNPNLAVLAAVAAAVALAAVIRRAVEVLAQRGIRAAYARWTGARAARRSEPALPGARSQT